MSPQRHRNLFYFGKKATVKIIPYLLNLEVDLAKVVLEIFAIHNGHGGTLIPLFSLHCQRRVFTGM